jgi:pantoate--beta-alanine ligase
MEITETIKQTRKLIAAAKAAGKTIGFVPTMGALHDGHVSLINAAAKKCDYVVVSIFVNPTQFGPAEDLDCYPRDLAGDLEKCEAANTSLVFTPSASEMYPANNTTWVDVEKLTENLCSANRPGHFRGVTTVCAKLFNIVLPDIAFFGQKDAQQVAVIKRMVKDLDMPLEIEACPIIRDPDGLAMSSRNQYLTGDHRTQALLLSQSLDNCRQLVKSGQTDIASLIHAINTTLSQAPDIEIDYISIVNPETLENIAKIEVSALIALAVKLKNTRLIDNMTLHLNKP